MKSEDQSRETATPPAHGASRLRDALSFDLLIFKESFRSFSANRNLETAATLAYYGFLSLMPLLLLVIFLLGFFMQSSDAILAGMQSLTAQLFPAFNEAILQDLLLLSQQRAWGVVSVIVLVWSMTPFAGAIRNAMIRIFKAERSLHFLMAKLLDLAAVLMLLVLFLFLVVARIHFMAPSDASVPAVSMGVRLLNVGGPFLLTTAVLSFFFRVFSPVRPKLSHLLAGAVMSALMLSVMRPLFGLVLQYNPNFGYAFGSLKAIFVLIVWVYYTFAVILFGAEVAANARRKEAILLRGLFLQGPRKARAPQRLLDRFVRAFEENEILFREGDAGNEMFYVRAGSVSLTKQNKVLRVMKAGDYFGEMSMLNNAPRTATATITEKGTELMAISQDNFDILLQENPKIVQGILREMALRLKATNEQL